MAKHRQGWCALCEQYTLHVQEDEQEISPFVHAFFSAICCGLWVPIWFLLAVFSMRRPFRCSICGQLEGGKTPHELAEERHHRDMAWQAVNKELQESVKATGEVGGAVLKSGWTAATGIAFSVARQFCSALGQVKKALRALAGPDDFMYFFYAILLAAAVIGIGVTVVVMAAGMMGHSGS